MELADFLVAYCQMTENFVRRRAILMIWCDLNEDGNRGNPCCDGGEYTECGRRDPAVTLSRVNRDTRCWRGLRMSVLRCM